MPKTKGSIYAHIFTLKNRWRKVFDKLAENFDNI